MAWVGEEEVARAMVVLLGGTGLTFEAEAAEDESVDADVKVLLHGQPTDYSIQVGGGYVALNQYLYKGAGRGPLDLLGAKHHGTWGVQAEDLRALAKAVQRQLLS